MDPEIENSIMSANFIFTHNPEIKIIAIRDNETSYTIVTRRARPQNINELYDRLASIISDGLISSMTSSLSQTESNDFQNFINQTLMNHEVRPEPLPENILNSLPNVLAESLEGVVGDKCPVCLDNFEEGENVIKLECSHVCHSACLRRWFLEKNTCPQCRFIPR